MKARCYNPTHKAYKRYGGRGITVCDAWLHSFPQFLADVGQRPSKKHSVERIDNNRSYEQGNVRWATQVEQCNNKSDNHFISYQGRTKTVTQWAQEYNIKPRTLFTRLALNWSIEQSFGLQTPPKRLPTPRTEEQSRKASQTMLIVANNRSTNRLFTWQEQTKTLAQWSRTTGINCHTTQSRLRDGWPMDQALGLVERPKKKKETS